MSSSSHVEFAVASHASDCDTYLPLLKNTQAYLRSLLERQAPDTVLTEAWEHFYRIYNGVIRRFVIAHGIRDADVDDCVQDVWSEVAARLVEFRRPRNRPGLRAWLYTLVRSTTTNVLRGKARHPAGSLDEAIRAGDEPSSNESDPADVCQWQWENALLSTVLAELRSEVSQRNSRLLHMRLIETRSVAEVAAALSLTREQVRSRQYRMLRKLRARMAVYTGRHFGEHAVI